MAFGRNGLCGAHAALPVVVAADHEDVCVTGHIMVVKSAMGGIHSVLCANLVNAFQVYYIICIL